MASWVDAFDRTGREVWRAPRDEKTTWATPVVVVHGKPQVVTAASNRVRGFDASPAMVDGELFLRGDTRAGEGGLRRDFYADAHTAALIPAAAENVWTMALEPGKSFGYALRRQKQGRRFRVEFDLTREVTPPPAPW